MIGSLPNGAHGFDCNRDVTASDAAAFAAKGYRFAIRYVRRTEPHEYDVSQREINTLIAAGLGVMLVQHVAPPGWSPSGGLGHIYGGTAGYEAQTAGLEPGANLWCDLEGVRPGTPHSDVVKYCNAWHSAALDAGYVPGLYVGDSAGLSALELYRTLAFKHYWSAYNLNADHYPVIRGAQMRQHPAQRIDLIPGYSTDTLDVDVISADLLGGTPLLMLPG